MPDSVEMPAPVKATMRAASAIIAFRSSTFAMVPAALIHLPNSLNEGWQGRKARRAYGQHLEQFAHAGGRDQALHAGLDGAGLAGVGGHQPRGALGNAEATEELGLGHRTV